MSVTLVVDGPDGFHMEGFSNIGKISRDPADLVAQMLRKNHQYPDGAVLFLGTMFAPVDDRDVPGNGFTHKVGDILHRGAATRLPRQPYALYLRLRALGVRRRPSDAQSGARGLL